MNIQQLEYIVAIDEIKHFRWTAKKYGVTQPGITMTVQNLEEELQLKIFVRNNKEKVVPTKEGAEVIALAKSILKKIRRMKQFAKELPAVRGQLRIGIIPTLVPYIRSVLVDGLRKQYAYLAVKIAEMIPEQMMAEMKKGSLDMAIISSFALEPKFKKHKLFDEKFYAYISNGLRTPKDKQLYVHQIEQYKLWLLRDDEYFSKQVLKICRLPKTASLQYVDGTTIATLIDMVDRYRGITLIPRLAIEGLSPEQKENVKELVSSSYPTREINLITLEPYQYADVAEAVKGVMLGYFGKIGSIGF